MRQILPIVAIAALTACGGGVDDKRDALSDEQRDAIAERVSPYGSLNDGATAAEPQVAAAAPPAATTVADGDAAGAHPGQAKYTTCVACHGADGGGGIGPQLQGRDADYISGRLVAYKNGEQVGDQSALMWGQAAALSDQDIDDLAGYIETL